MADDIRQKRVQKMKDSWGETNTQRKKKKKEETAEKDKGVNVSKFAEIINKKPGEC